jgi:hypothetical protein
MIRPGIPHHPGKLNAPKTPAYQNTAEAATESTRMLKCAGRKRFSGQPKISHPFQAPARFQ